ncbi:MAG: hypothetical protein IJK40_07030 [Clostridia bacterium]|nr:hypothetical protein [Clostridia bacterium]
MKRIFEIDKNFRVETSVAREDAVFYDPRKEPFAICGVFYDGRRFRRIPQNAAKATNDGVAFLHSNTAGGRVRFKTDSPYIVINAKMSGVDQMPHFPLTGSAGFDLYADGRYERSFVPDAAMRKGYESEAWLGGNQMREIMIHMPLYANVDSLCIGLAGGAAVLPAEPYENIPPVVYYGSSITQGGCASRPGNAYENMLSRMLNVDHINLGFSGSARGEEAITNYIAGLEMSVFVLDYDHNAPDVQHLKNTHEKLFLAVRKAHPELPVVMLSRPKYRLDEDEQARRETVKQTYENALAAGDKNVYFLDGPALMALAGDDGTVDNCHPNDLGFYSMAKALEPVLREILK